MPPHRPQGGQLSRCACSKFQRPSTRLRTRTSMPRPPRYFAGAAGILPQPAAFYHHRAFDLDALDRAVAHVALAHRDGGGLAVLGRPAAPAAAFDALHHEAALGLGMHAEEHHRAAEQAMMPGRHPVAHGLRQGLDDGVHHGGHDDAPARHRGRKARHHDAAFRNDHLQGAERAFIDRIERPGQRLVGDAGARQRARVDRPPCAPASSPTGRSPSRPCGS